MCTSPISTQNNIYEINNKLYLYIITAYNFFRQNKFNVFDIKIKRPIIIKTNISSSQSLVSILSTESFFRKIYSFFKL